MDNQKLNKIVQTIQSKLHNPEDFYNWLKIAIDDIILREVLPPMAFGYLIGTTRNQWRNDLHDVYTLLPARSQHAFRMGIANCLKFLKINDQEKYLNNPIENGGKNIEHLALVYIELMREYRVAEAMRYIPTLIASRFINSRALYDAALLTWRLMPDAEPDIDWVEVFSNDRENRFQPKYSGIIALGMCVAKPLETNFYLIKWQPLRQFFAEIPSTQDEKLRVYGSRLLQAINSTLREYESDTTVSQTTQLTNILNLSFSGIKVNLSDRLRAAHENCHNVQHRKISNEKHFQAYHIRNVYDNNHTEVEL